MVFSGPSKVPIQSKVLESRKKEKKNESTCHPTPVFFTLSAAVKRRSASPWRVPEVIVADKNYMPVPEAGALTGAVASGS